MLRRVLFYGLRVFFWFLFELLMVLFWNVRCGDEMLLRVLVVNGMIRGLEGWTILVLVMDQVMGLENEVGRSLLLEIRKEIYRRRLTMFLGSVVLVERLISNLNWEIPFFVGQM